MKPNYLFWGKIFNVGASFGFGSCFSVGLLKGDYVIIILASMGFCALLSIPFIQRISEAKKP